MTGRSQDIISELEGRELVSQLAGGDELRAHLTEGSRTIYCGFDPTAESLHIGSVVPLLLLKRFQMAGHKPIALIGGATGLIGDPSFKATERQLNSSDKVEAWVEKLKPQLGQFLEFDSGKNSALLLNNLEWTKGYELLSFLRDIGKHFSVNSMIQKESVRQRLDRDEGGISYTEFSYMLLQSYDFAELNRRYGCTVQVGGSDQWGNITGGIDLARRMHRTQVYGMTTPLVTKADGSKFGKTEKGTVWLSGLKTSPYAFYQFWLNVADLDVYRYLKYFTFLTVNEINEIRQCDSESKAKPEGQRILAEEVTELLHGKGGLIAAQRISEGLFSNDISKLTNEDLSQLELDGLPCSEIEGGSKGIVEALVITELAKSNKMAREFVGNNAVSVNGLGVDSVDFQLSQSSALNGKYFVLKRGKKLFHLVKLV